MLALDPDARAAALPQLTAAVGSTYAVPLVLMAWSAIAAAVGLRRRRTPTGSETPLAERMP